MNDSSQKRLVEDTVELKYLTYEEYQSSFATT